MSRSASIDATAVMIGVAAAIGGAAIGYLGLVALARPANAPARIATIAQQTDESEQIRSRLKSPPAYPRGAVCDGGGEAGLSVIRQEVAALAARNHEITVDISGAPAAPDEANGGLQPVNLSIDGSGASTSVFSFLQSLSTATPYVFVDKLDLKSVEGKVTLKLTGRIFCSPIHL